MTPFQNYIKLLLRLHDTPLDSEDADEIRDKLDVHYYKLTEPELKLLNDLSAVICPGAPPSGMSPRGNSDLLWSGKFKPEVNTVSVQSFEAGDHKYFNVYAGTPPPIFKDDSG